MAGLSAAAWSARQGRSVVLVEKGELGGSAKHAGFIWTAPSVDVLRRAYGRGVGPLAGRRDQRRDPGLQGGCTPGVENCELARRTDRHLCLAYQQAIVRSVGLGNVMSGLFPVVSQGGKTLTPHLTSIGRDRPRAP